MKPIFTLGNIIASLFMIYIGIRLLTIHEQSDFLPKYVTIILGILILFCIRANGSKTMAPIKTRKKMMVEGEISSTATLIKRYGVPQRKPTRANLPHPTLVNLYTPS